MRPGKKQSGFGYRHVLRTDAGGVKGCIVERWGRGRTGHELIIPIVG
jgi:hypothetical protein